MSNVYFDRCVLEINGTGLVAQNARLSTSNSIEPVSTLGRKGVAGYSPNGPLQTTLEASYYMDMVNEPNYEVLSQIKNVINGHNYDPVSISLGNVSGDGYLSRINIQGAANAPLEVNIGYDIFQHTSGFLDSKQDSVSGIIENRPIAHAWGVVVKSQNGYKQDPTYSFAYNFAANWDPIYNIGQSEPFQVNLNSARETISIVRNEYSGASFSGDTFDVFVFQDSPSESGHIEIRDIEAACNDGGIDSLASLANVKRFDLGDSVVISAEIDARLDDVVRVNYTIIKDY